MFSSSSWLHLRIPFSYFLLPVFLFALAVSPNVSAKSLLWTFIIVHIFIYPASNGYNSYFDKDEKSIGGLKNPPPVNKGLYYLSLLLDVAGIVLGIILINVTFGIMLLVYGLVSKAYSHPWIRLKKFPIAGWLVAGLFQGLFTFVMCYVGINNYGLETALKPAVLIPGTLSTIMLWANYPMTQIYQHEEDGRRGDLTLSRMLGIVGTFFFVSATFTVVTVGFVLYLTTYFSSMYAWLFMTALLPVVTYFFIWFYQAYNDQRKADYKHTMWLNFISATCLNIYFIYLFLTTTHIVQAFS
jgi:1,4-dihydroxy-2-naphthoate octaprenyltransferase